MGLLDDVNKYIEPYKAPSVQAVQTAKDVLENIGGPNSSGLTTPPSPVEKAVEKSLQSMDSANRDRGLSSSSSPVQQQTSSSSDIPWPSVTKDEIFGLPPISICSDPYLDDTSMQEKLVKMSFPVLSITPLNVQHDEGSSDSQKKVSTTSLVSIPYQFACQTDGSISHSHTNNYGPTFVEGALQQTLSSNVMRDMWQLGKVMGGPVGGIASGAYNQLNSFLNQLTETLQASAAGMSTNANFQAIEKAAFGIGRDSMNALIQGARLDIPNVWQDSSTNLSWTFNIKLRTMASRVEDKAYWQDILKPMLILCYLSLPSAGECVAYNYPPYIKAEMGALFRCKIGGISNFTWTIPLSEMNLRGIPREIDVTLTITDMYNIMVSGKVDSNANFPSGCGYVNEVLKNARDLDSALIAPALKGKGTSGSSAASSATKGLTSSGKISDAAKAAKDKMDQFGAVAAGNNIYNSMLANANTDMLSVFDVEGIVDGLNPLAMDISAYSDLYDPASILSGAFDFSQLPIEEYATMGLSLGNGALSLASAGKQILNIPNITQLTSNTSLADMLLRGQPLNIAASALSNLNIDSNIYMNYLSTPGSAVSTITSRLFSFFNKSTVYKLSNGIFTSMPAYQSSALPSVVMPLIQDFIANDDFVNENITNYLGLSSYSLWGAASVALSAISGSGVDEAQLYDSILKKIYINNAPLSNLLKGSSYAATFISKAVSSLTNNLFYKTDVVQELASFRNSVRSDSEFNTGIDHLYRHMGTMMGLSTMEGLLKQNYRKRYCKVHVEVSDT